MNRVIKNILVLMVCLFAATAGQSQVNVSFTMRPPYSAYIRDYYHLENRAIIIITNTSRSTLDIKLGGSISNVSRGVYIKTAPGYNPSMPITLGPNATVTLTANPDLMRFFDQANASTNANDAMLATILRTGTLPEGNYQVCVDAYDYNTGRLLSARGNGCFSFNLSLLDPPVITFPQNNYVYPPEQVNLNFNWTPPLGNLAGSLIEYDQVVVQLEPGQNPNDAIAAARDFGANNPVLNKKNTLSQTYVTQPYDLPFKRGRKYAMQVVARDRNQQVLLNNMGRSEIVVFSVGEPGLPSTPIIDEPMDVYTTTQLKGVLRYYWPVLGPSSNKNNLGNATSGANENASGLVAQQVTSGMASGTINQDGPLFNQNGVGLQEAGNNSVYSAALHSNGDFSGYRSGLLAGVTVQLIQAIQIINPVWVNQSGNELYAGNIMLPQGNSVTTFSGSVINLPVLATATSTANGSFSFNVPNLEDFDFSLKQGKFGSGNGNSEFQWSVEGVYRKVLMVKISTQGAVYYAHPMKFVSGIPADKEMGTFYCKVKTISTTVRVTDADDFGLVKDNVEVLVMRKTPAPSLVPRDEIEPGHFGNYGTISIYGVTYTIVAKKNTTAGGEAKFDNLIPFGTCMSEWPYYIYVRPTDTYNTTHSFSTAVKSFKLTLQNQWNTAGDCFNPSTKEVKNDCIQLNCFGLFTDAIKHYSVAGDDNVYKSYRYHFVTLKQPRIYALVKNSVAGGNNQAQNEGNANWYLWRVSDAGMLKAKASAAAGKWGALMKETYAGFSILKGVLQANGTPMVLERSGSTGIDGRIDENNLPAQGPMRSPVGYFYVLEVKKSGFEPIVYPVNQQSQVNNISGDMSPAPYGMAFNLGTLLLKPKGEAKLTLVSETGNSLYAYAYYIETANGQTGKHFQTVFESNGDGTLSSNVYMDLPSGNNRKIVIVPSLSKYMRDTISVNIPETGQLEQTVVVASSLHRIYLNIRGNYDFPLKNVKVELMTQPGTAVISALTRSPYINEGTEDDINLPPAPGSNNDGLQVSDGSQQAVLWGQNPDNDNNPYTRLTNSGGGVDFAFTAGGSSFTFRITGPGGSNYVTIEKNIQSNESATWKRVDIKLKAGRTVSGQVRFGQVPVSGARVKIQGSYPVMQVFTDPAGNYEMKGVPMDTILTFTASKQPYVGMTFTEGQSLTSVSGNVVYYPLAIVNQDESLTRINFTLRIYDSLDLSRLLGFPMEVTALTENVNRNPGAPKSVKISGMVTISDSLNQVFKMSGTSVQGETLNTIDFSNRTVVADVLRNAANIPYCRPVSLPVSTDINEQAITIHGFYAGRMFDNSSQGITLNSFGSGNQAQGVAQGKVLVDEQSVIDDNFSFLPDQEMFLQNGNTLQFPVFTSQGVSVVNATAGIPVVNGNGGEFSYALDFNDGNFTAIASKAGSKLFRDSIILDTRVQTIFQHVSPASMSFPLGRVKINNQRRLATTSNTVNETRALGSFSMKWNRVYMNDAGIRFDGMLTAAGMNMPVNGGRLYPDRFELAQGSLQTGAVKLLGSVPVTVAPGIGASFGYDAVRPVPAWYLSITSGDNEVEAASIEGSGLNGLSAASKIPFSSIWFYSEGTKELTLMNNLPSYKLHNVADFSLQSVAIDDASIALNGLLETGIPGFPAYNSGLIYESTGPGTLSDMKLRQFSMTPVSMNGVVLDFNGGNSYNMQLSNGQLTMKGRIADEQPGVFSPLAYTLTKTSSLTELVVDRATPQQTILGADDSRIRLTDVEGKMTVAKGEWNHFYFMGNMPDNMGFTDDGKRVRFDVFGNLKVEKQSVKLQNVSSGFGGLSMQYDMAKQRMMGSMNFDKQIGSVKVNGGAEIVFDKYGYYFMASGAMQMSNPAVEGTTFMIFGDYNHLQSDRVDAIEAMLKQYSYYYENLSDLPPGYVKMNNINGFFLEAGAAIPFPGLPNFDIDLGLVEAELNVQVGGDVRVGMQFGDADMYNMGMGVFVKARFSVGVSFIHFCGGVELSGKGGVDMDGSYWSNGNYDLAITGFLSITGMAWGGGGLACDAECDGICGRTEVSGTVGLEATGQVKHNDSSFRIRFAANSFPPKKD
ncbi:MAG: hypothetical protein EOO09_13205 [Chitinophagaceae bacterium]|nr:MAG: hypothetical protein EOO09_13205 [Chitinophagaceae bacterium]